MTKIILFATVFWLPFLLAYMLINETKFKKNIIIGVTLPNEAHEDPEVQGILVSFKKNTWLICIALTALLILFMFIPGGSMMTLFMIWIDLVIVCPYIPYLLARRKLFDIKNERGWVQEKRTVKVNTSALSSEKWLSAWLFVPPVILCLVPVLFDRPLTAVYVMFALMCALFWAGYRYLYRNKAEMVDESIELTKALSQIRKYNWGKMWLVTSYSMAAYALTMWLMEKNALLSIIAVIVITVIVVYAAFRIEMRTRKVQETLTKDSGQEWYVDDDDKWIGGILYFNPDDSRWIINNRIGMNSSINLATMPGKLMMALCVLMILALPFMGIFFDSMDKTPIEYTVSEETMLIKCGMSKYEIVKDDIDEIALLEELPSNLRRKFGSATEKLLEGRFASDDTGDIKLLLDPTQEPFILIKTKDGAYYLFGTRDGNETAEIFEQLNN